MSDLDLSVICPVLNEEFFLPLYLKAVLEYADEVLFLDGGSQDRSLEIIKNMKLEDSRIRLWQMPQKGKPYSPEWKEGERRNYLVKKARGKWLLALDIDEFLSDSFRDIFRNKVLYQNKIHVFGFPFISFWEDCNTIRKNAVNDPYWEGPVYRLIRRDYARYDYQGNHSQLLYNGKYTWLETSRSSILKEVFLLHYHYSLGLRVKENDNRRGDLNCLEEFDKPDWNYNPPNYNIITEQYQGKHPGVIQNYLERMSK